MARDSLFGGNVVWSGRPARVRVPALYRVGSLVCGVIAVATTASAVAASMLVREPPGASLLFAGGMATLGLLLDRVPRWWREGLAFTITDESVIVRRGNLRRFIDRSTISYARIRWDADRSDVGDLELVRAVPAGALRRTLTLELPGVEAPERVWACVRAGAESEPAPGASITHAMRIEPGETVLWSGVPRLDWRRWLPRNGRAFGSIAIGLALLSAAVTAGATGLHGVGRVLEAGVPSASVPFAALVTSVALTIALLAVGSLGVLYEALVRPGRLDPDTRYLVTDRRVVIRRGRDELFLPRDRIADVIDLPDAGGTRTLFLVLDGPSARALASSGAFGEARRAGLQPVIARIDHADEALLALRPQRAAPTARPTDTAGGDSNA
jgi:hypothetical protein